MRPVGRSAAGIFAVGVAVIAIAGCGGDGDEPTTETSPPPATTAEGSLTITREDGSELVLDEATVFCGPSSTEAKRPAIFVRTPDPRADKPLFSLEAIVADVQRDPVLRMPTSYIESDPEGGVLFIYDPEGGTVGGNEANSTYEDSSGTIRFEAVECDPEPSVEFTVSGQVDSEFGNLEPVGVEGGFRVGPAAG